MTTEQQDKWNDRNSDHVRGIRCKVPRCREKLRENGLCESHYSMWCIAGRPADVVAWANSYHPNQLKALFNCKEASPMAKKHKGCTVAGCTGKHLARGMCGRHYYRWNDAGKPDIAKFIASAASSNSSPAEDEVQEDHDQLPPPEIETPARATRRSREPRAEVTQPLVDPVSASMPGTLVLVNLPTPTQQLLIGLVGHIPTVALPTGQVVHQILPPLTTRNAG